MYPQFSMVLFFQYGSACYIMGSDRVLHDLPCYYPFSSQHLKFDVYFPNFEYENLMYVFPLAG